jgi:DNA polymerase-3 subunit epsilon
MAIAVSLDFETADNGPDSACAIGMVRIEDARITDTLYRLIRPPRRRMLYTWVHGLSWEDVRDAPFFADVWPDLRAFMQDASHLVAHNAGFDRRVLQGCCAAAGLAPPALPFLCTLKGSRRALHLPSHKLSDVCAHFAIDLTHHHAESDARAAAEILLRLRDLGLSDDLMRLR